MTVIVNEQGTEVGHQEDGKMNLCNPKIETGQNIETLELMIVMMMNKFSNGCAFNNSSIGDIMCEICIIDGATVQTNACLVKKFLPRRQGWHKFDWPMTTEYSWGTKYVQT